MSDANFDFQQGIPKVEVVVVIQNFIVPSAEIAAFFSNHGKH